VESARISRERRVCKAEGCTNQLDSRNVSGFCYAHYNRQGVPHLSILRQFKSVRERDEDVPRSLEIRIQEELFPRYRAWILECLTKYGHLTVKDAISGGAMWLKRNFGHGSSDTTREWLNELANPLEGEFEVFDPKFENWGPCVRQKTPELQKELAKSERP
jgi:hypothetical protein